MDKAEYNIIKTIRSEKPMSDKDAKEWLKKKEEHDKWLESIKKNYPGICYEWDESLESVSFDGVTIYYSGSWW